MGLQWIPIANPSPYRIVAVGGFLEDGTSLVQTMVDQMKTALEEA